MLAVAAVAVLLAGLFYARAFGVLERRQRWTLFSLRVAAILLVVLLLFRPVFSYTKALKERPSLVFVVDQSASMSIADDAAGKTRFQQAGDQVAAWWPKLADDFDLHLLTFSDRVWKLDDVEAAGHQRARRQGHVALSRVAGGGRAGSQEGPRSGHPAFRRHPQHGPKPVGGGRHAGRGGPRRGRRGVAPRRRFVPRHPGDRHRLPRPPDAQQHGQDHRVDRGHRAGRPGDRRSFWRTTASRSREAELTLDNVEGSQEVAFEFRPTVKGRHTYTVRVAAGRRGEDQGEQPADGGRVGGRAGDSRALHRGDASRRVRRPGRPVPGQGPRPGVLRPGPDAAQRVPQADEHRGARRSTSIPTDEATIDTFDVFILGDLDSSYFRPEQQELFVKRIRDGAGLVMLGGYHSLGPGGYAGTPLGKILPVEPGNREIGQITDPFLPTLTPEGARHPIFANIADFFPTEAGEPKTPGLPSLDWVAPGSRRPGPAPPCWPLVRVDPRRRRCSPSSRWTRDARPSSPATRRGGGSRVPGRWARTRRSCGSGGRWCGGWPVAPARSRRPPAWSAARTRRTTSPTNRSASRPSSATTRARAPGTPRSSPGCAARPAATRP